MSQVAALLAAGFSEKSFLMFPGTITWPDTDSSKETLGDLPDLESQCHQHKIQDVPKSGFI